MTEQKWLVSSDPAEMIRYLRGNPDEDTDRDIVVRISEHKVRMWVIACRDREKVLRPHQRRQEDGDLKNRYLLLIAIDAWPKWIGGGR